MMLCPSLGWRLTSHSSIRGASLSVSSHCVRSTDTVTTLLGGLGGYLVLQNRFLLSTRIALQQATASNSAKAYAPHPNLRSLNLPRRHLSQTYPSFSEKLRIHIVQHSFPPHFCTVINISQSVQDSVVTPQVRQQLPLRKVSK